MKNYALIDFKMINPVSDKEIETGKVILISNSKIEAVKSQKDPIPFGYKIIDLKGQYVLPGLINAHAHLFGTGKPSKVLGTDKKSQQKLLKILSTKLGQAILKKVVYRNVKNALLGGTTTIRSMGDFFYSDVAVRDWIKNGKTGPRLLVSGPAITAVGGHGYGTFAEAGVTPEDFTKLVQDRVDHHVDIIKICVTGGVMDATKKGQPGEVKMTLEQAKTVCDKAHACGLKVASHTESAEGMDVAIQAGVDTIEHGSELSPEDIKIAKQRDVAIVSTYSPALPLAVIDPSLTKLDELATFNTEVVLERIIKAAITAEKEGLKNGLGTDASCPFCTQYNVWRELYFYTLKMNKSNFAAIKKGTIENAQILGVDKVTGSIEAGKDADLIVCPESPIKDLHNLAKLSYVFVRGHKIKNPHPKKNKAVEEALKNAGL